MLRVTFLICCVMVSGLACSVTCSIAYGQASFEEPPHWNAKRHANFFQYGELTELSEKRVPVGWDDVQAFELGNAKMLKNTKGIMQLKCADDGGETSVSTTIELPKGIEFVTILTRMRGPTVVKGDSKAAGAGMVFSLAKNDAEKRSFPRLEPFYDYGSLGGWKTYRVTARVMPGENKLNVQASIVDSKGTLQLDRVLVVSSKRGFQATADQKKRLMEAIRTDDAVDIERLLFKTPKLLEFRDGTAENGTPLIHAAFYNAPKVASILVKRGADLEASDESWQNTPLAWCCWWGNAEVAEILIDAGAETKNFAKMAAIRNNPRPRGTPEDFDRIVELIEAAKKKAEEQKTTQEQ